VSEKERSDRIETLYHESAWDLAEKVVDLEDKVQELEKDSRKLTALEAAGVDNWEGYSHAMRILRGEEDED
jgi:uncharacterized protein with PhoU and TrkA domain